MRVILLWGSTASWLLGKSTLGVWSQVYTGVSVETSWLLSQCRPGVLRRIRVWAGLLTRGVMPSHLISRLVAVKGHECVTVFHNQISSLSVICGWDVQTFLNFLASLFSYLVTTCGGDLSTLYLYDLVWYWVVFWLSLGLMLEQQDLVIDLYVVVLNIHFRILVGLLLCFRLCISLT